MYERETLTPENLFFPATAEEDWQTSKEEEAAADKLTLTRQFVMRISKYEYFIEYKITTKFYTPDALQSCCHWGRGDKIAMLKEEENAARSSQSAVRDERR
ncbi:hypothetical protein E2C01_075432 [Portunus trituberculatus]|uniref:Uncharacterized protein n=1 Tax=Portunus trituberculatus TaxID=210409 RepID=A0A5B7IG51_PORTR|nr:hypothetical protein [Portunus trituberculatus]